jgi:hypothetical protein
MVGTCRHIIVTGITPNRTYQNFNEIRLHEEICKLSELQKSLN